MVNLVEKSFGTNLQILRMFGLYPPDKYKRVYKIYSYFIYCVMIAPIAILSCMYLLLEDVNMDQIADNAFLACQMACKLVKFLPFLTNSEEIRRTIYLLECPIFTMYTERQQNIITECIRICNRNCKLFLSFCFFSIIGLAVKPLVASGKPLPLEIWSPLDLKQNPTVYYSIFVYMILGFICGGFSNGAIDPLISGLALHASTQLKVLKDNLENLSEDAEEVVSRVSSTGNNILMANIIYEKIGACINHHNAILDFVDNYETVYSSVVFPQFASSVFVICVCCLCLSMVEPFTVIFFAMSIFLITMLWEIFLYSYYGTTLFEENNGLTEAVYMGKWYEYDVKSRKALIILMERSKRPMIVTAGKILDLSLVTFSTILRRAYSLLAVLKTY